MLNKAAVACNARGVRLCYHNHDWEFFDGERTNFVTLGEGCAPLADVAAWVKRNAPDVWVVAEQDRSELPAAEAVARNGAYLKSQFGE